MVWSSRFRTATRRAPWRSPPNNPTTRPPSSTCSTWRSAPIAWARPSTSCATRVPALLLGPIAVAPEDRGKGYAKALIWHGLGVARALGHRIVLLVGDAPYYEQFGFTRALAVELSLPGWVDEARFLGLELVPGALAGVQGLVGRAE
jgi:predicted N-acetyltransferase YhbS